MTTYSSLSLTHSLTHARTHALSTAAAAADFALLLLIALLEIVLLLPEEHKGLSFKQREAWWELTGCDSRVVVATWVPPPASKSSAAEPASISPNRGCERTRIERNRGRGWSVKRLWTASERGASGIVGGERSKDALWVVRRGEVNNCYLKSEYHSVSQD